MKQATLVKQAIIVPRWLKMSPGKIASQCCHAALLGGGLFTDKRVVLGVESEAHIQTLQKLCDMCSMALHSFRDSGPTTEGTDGIITVYWIRGSEEDVNYVTEQLELY